MSNFWASKITPSQPAPQPVTSGAWWAPAPPANSQAQPVAPVVIQTPQQVQYGSTTAPGQVPIGVLLAQDEYTSTRAESARDSSRCPECESVNFISPKGMPNAMKQCFDCGHNDRFSQTMSGITTGGQNIPVKTARQQHLNTRQLDFGAVFAHV